MLERADYAPPFEFYSHALTALGGRDKLLARLGPEAADAIEEFLSLTLTHERGHSPSLEGFLDWVERGGTEIKRDMERGRDEVRVMTVHGAKGLEADIVILPDTTAPARAAQPQGPSALSRGRRAVSRCPMPKRRESVKRRQGGGRRRNAARTSPPALCGADPRPRPALCLRLREQERRQATIPGTSWREAAAEKLGVNRHARRRRDHAPSAHVGRRNRRHRDDAPAQDSRPARLDRRARAAANRHARA